MVFCHAKRIQEVSVIITKLHGSQRNGESGKLQLRVDLV